MSPSRRQFVAGVACALALPVLGDLRSAAGPVEAKPAADGWLATVKPAALPDGALEGKYRPEGFILTRSGSTIRALDTRCTHKGCAVRPKGSVIDCPCHHSQFDAQGQVLKGPAKLPLARHALRLNQDGIIEVQTKATINSDDPAGVLNVAPAATKP